MMNLMKYCLLSVFCSVMIAHGAEVLLWSLNMNTPERWKPNSSGKMTVSGDEKENSVRFDVKFPDEAKDRWVYPNFSFIGGLGEKFEDADTLVFDIRAAQSNPEAGYKHAFIQMAGKKIAFPKPPASGDWQHVEVDLKKQELDYTKIKYIQIGLNPNSPEFFYELKNIRLYGKSSVQAQVELADAIDFHAPGTAYRIGEKVTFRMKPPYREVPSTYRVEDWSGKTVAEGEFPDEGGGTLDLTALPRGYYRLELKSDKVPFSGKRSFAILPDMRARKKNPGMTYCLDTCLSWHGVYNFLAWQSRDKELNWRSPGPNFDLGVELIDRLGVSLVRERISAAISKTPDEYNFGVYRTNAEKLAARNVQILDMYHAPPKWCTMQPEKKFAGDALEIYSFAKKTAEGLRGQVTYWEFGNEQDLSGMYCPKNTGAGIWDYVAMLKAASYGHKEADPNIRVLNGGLAFLPVRPAVEVYFQNDYKLYGDAFNVHTYRYLNGYPEMVADIKSFLKKNGAEDMPVWFTEFGTHSDGAGEVKSHLSGLKEHSEEQELIVAEFIPKANVLFQQLGVAKSFLFVFMGYNEAAGDKVWGQLRHDHTVKPGYAAMAVQIEQLGDAVLLGEMKMPEGVRAFLYRQPDGSQTVALWSISPVETRAKRGEKITPVFEQKVTLPASGSITATEMLGSQKTLQAQNGKLEVISTRFPQYLAGLSGLKADIPAEPVKEFVRKDEEEYDKSIIMNIVFPLACKVSYMGESISIPDDKTDAVLQVWNLSDTEKTGTLNGKGCVFTGVPAEKITLAPKSRREFPIKIDCSSNASGEIVFSGTFNGKKTSRLTVPYKQLHRMAGDSIQEPIPWAADPKLWKGPFVKHTEFDEAEKAVAIDIAFPPKTHPWTYPEYKLQLPQESLKGAYGIAFEMKSSADINMCLFITLMNTPGRPDRYTELNMTPPKKDVWEEHVLIFTQDPGEITTLRFGMTPKSGADYRLMIRNVRALYRSK